jgi:hypothetical protein
MPPYSFPQKREQSLSLVEVVKGWFERRGDVLEVKDVQDDPFFYYMGDLMIVRRGGVVQFVEVKCESSYTRHDTANLAIERYSSVEKQSPGGPWHTDADFYVHIYADGLLVVMSRRRLVEWIEHELSLDANTFPYRLIPNMGWTTGTYLVPRSRAKAALNEWYREYEASGA